MKGSMRERKPGKWELRVFTGVDFNGKKHQSSRTFHGTEREAETALAAFVTEISEKRAPTCGVLTLARYLDQWQQGRVLVVAESTVITQQGIIDRHINPHIGSRRLSRLTALDIEGLYARLSSKLSDKTIESVHAVIDKALGDAVKKGLLPRNIAKLVNRRRSRQQDIEVPKRDDVDAAISKANNIVGMGMVIISATGIRRGELLALRWSEIDLDRGLIRINRNLQYINKQIVICPTKTKAGKRTVAIPESLVEGLKGYRKWQRQEHLKEGIRTNLVIHNRQGDAFKPTTYSAAVKLAGSKAGIINLGPHSLRHLHATYLMEQGIHPKVVQERLGHASITTTLMVYSHVLDHMQDEAAEMAGGVVSIPTF